MERYPQLAVADLGWFLGFHETPLWAGSTTRKVLMIGYTNGTPLSDQKTKKTASVAHLSMP